ncbi:MAG TPA: ParB/RepB/Spo0J family partition protein [Friedmanniella sp.]
MTVTTERRGLGRGLGELFQRTDVPVAEPGPGPAAPPEQLVPVPAGSSYADLPLDSIVANPRQPRTVFDGDALDELVDSIREVGLLQPVVVRPLGDDTYELVMGERRWRASQLAGTGTIPAIVRQTEDHDLLRDALLENLHRAQLNPLEEAAAYQQLLEDFGCTQDELATRIKRSRPQISNTIRLLRLPPTVQRRVAAGVLSAGHARALLALPDPLGQERLAQRVVAEGLSVRATEELVTLGERQQPAGPTKRGAREPSERARVLAESLTDRLDTRVRVDGGRNRGRIVIDFASDEDLARIASLLGG